MSVIKNWEKLSRDTMSLRTGDIQNSAGQTLVKHALMLVLL